MQVAHPSHHGAGLVQEHMNFPSCAFAEIDSHKQQLVTETLPVNGSCAPGQCDHHIEHAFLRVQIWQNDANQE